jgi:conjugative transfer signal peptidase TraF
VTGRVAILRTTLGAAALLLSTIAAKPTARYIWNASESVPIGLYQLRPIGKLVAGELVAVQPPESLATFLESRRYLPRRIPLLKRVLALPGQTVCRDRLTITIDEIWVGNARDSDSRGRPMPIWQGCRVIAGGEVFLMNRRSEDSLDGRYFGVLPTTAIIGRAEPLWTGGEQ